MSAFPPSAKRGFFRLQAGATQAAALEAQRLEELEREEAHHKQEQQERARLRGDQALRKEKGIQVRNPKYTVVHIRLKDQMK